MDNKIFTNKSQFIKRKEAVKCSLDEASELKRRRRLRKSNSLESDFLALFFLIQSCRCSSTRQQKPDPTHHPKKKRLQKHVFNFNCYAFGSLEFEDSFYMFSLNAWLKEPSVSIYRHQLYLALQLYKALALLSFEVGICVFFFSSFLIHFFSSFSALQLILNLFLLSLIKKANITNPQLVAVHEFTSWSLKGIHIAMLNEGTF